MISFDSAPASDLVFPNNIAPRNRYGIHATTGEGAAALDMFAPGHVFAGNVVPGAATPLYPTGNFYPATLADVGFRDAMTGDLRLAPTSRYVRMGTDGRDPGVDRDSFAAVQAARSP